MTTPSFAGMSDKERLAWLGSRIIQTGNVEKVDTFCGRLFRQSGLKREGNAGFIVGDTGIGKSTAVAYFADRLAERLQKEHPDAAIIRPDVHRDVTPIRPIWMKSDRHGFRRPLAVAFVPPQPTFKSLLELTAMAVGVTLAPRWSFSEGINKVTTQIKQQNTKMVIFDEVQQITEGKISSYEAADVFKYIIKAQAQVVCVGMPGVTDLITGESGNPQLERLNQVKIDLGPFTCSLSDFPELDGNGLPVRETGFKETAYRRFCLALDDRSNPILPFDESSMLSAPETAIRLWCACEGKIGRISDLLFPAADLAIERGLSRITPKTLQAAYRNRGYDDADNWFAMDWERVRNRFEAISVRGVYTPPKETGVEEIDDTSKPKRVRGRPRGSRNPLKTKR